MKHMDRAYNSATLNQIISTALVNAGIITDHVKFFIHDDASVNKKSSSELKSTLYPHLFDISCYSHILQRVGEHTDAPLVLYPRLPCYQPSCNLGRDLQKELDRWFHKCS
jgi:hypothetical protein